jgi:hypothetical protein
LTVLNTEFGYAALIVFIALVLTQGGSEGDWAKASYVAYAIALPFLAVAFVISKCERQLVDETVASKYETAVGAVGACSWLLGTASFFAQKVSVIAGLVFLVAAGGAVSLLLLYFQTEWKAHKAENGPSP